MTGARTLDVDEVAVLVNDGPANVASVLGITEGAASTLWTRQVLAAGRVRAIVRNIAPDASFDDVHRVAEAVAGALGIGSAEVVFSQPDGVAVGVTLLPVTEAA